MEFKHIKSYKVFEETLSKPVKKFPTEPAAHWNYIYDIVKDGGLNPYELEKGNNDSTLQDFFFEFCSKKNVVFPNMKDSEGWSKKGQSDPRYEKFIFGESVFLIPESYDSKDDFANATLKKASWMEKMKDMMKSRFKTKEEMDKYEDDLEKNVKFGNTDWDWVNPALKIIHDKLGSHYKDGKLRVWMPKDRDYDPWEGMDYPHKYNVVGEPTRPNGVYYLSDIEKYIEDKYGIKDPLLYKFIIDNQYIEGRYWERVWSFPTEDRSDKGGSNSKLQKSGFGKYGMEPTENITHILNILEKDFGNEIKGNDYEGFPVYIDYYKKIEPKY
jgi:hypothetical protein